MARELQGKGVACKEPPSLKVRKYLVERRGDREVTHVTRHPSPTQVEAERRGEESDKAVTSDVVDLEWLGFFWRVPFSWLLWPSSCAVCTLWPSSHTPPLASTCGLDPVIALSAYPEFDLGSGNAFLRRNSGFVV